MPKPKKQRKRNHSNSSAFERELNCSIQDGWNGILQNICGHPFAEAETELFSKGKQFCPVELDPLIIRMQRELDVFFRALRIKWIFIMSQTKELNFKESFTKSQTGPPLNLDWNLRSL